MMEQEIARDQAVDDATALMARFAERTGLMSSRTPHRYLWTDAFAVCNFLSLARLTGLTTYRELALALIDQVHQVLGRFRADDVRTGWLSGLSDSEGRHHPTRAGLRIGKMHPERAPGEPYDERLEWDRDGQYFHYLTKWMHALNQAALFTGQSQLNRWARELAFAAHEAFVHGKRRGHERGVVWKMSTDLTRPLVPAMGQHDALDGYLTCLELHDTAASFGDAPKEPNLARIALDFAEILRPETLGTDDPLGLGGLLIDTYRAARLGVRHEHAAKLAPALLSTAWEGLAHYSRRQAATVATSHRLAFRELGLAIGLSALGLLEQEQPALNREHMTGSGEHRRLLEPRPPELLAAHIREFWLKPEHRRTALWSEHRDINEVMLATSLVPQGFLEPMRAER